MARPDRFSAFASLSLQYPDLAVQELEHAMTLPGIRGVAIGGSVAGDDTVLVIAEERRGGMSLATEFRSLAGLDDSMVAPKKEK